MITSKHGYVGTRKCVKYSGTHEELRDMLKEGDIVTLLWQNDDKSESIKITGTVIKHTHDAFRVCVDSETFMVSEHPFDISSRLKYVITNIKRPVENMLPDAPGPWFDKNLDTWIVNDDLNAIRVSCDETWLIGGGILLPSEYEDYAPFKKINIIKESGE